MNNKPLSNQQKIFIQEYLRHGDAKKAAKVAGYKSPDKQGDLILNSSAVQFEIQSRKAKKE